MRRYCVRVCFMPEIDVEVYARLEVAQLPQKSCKLPQNLTNFPKLIDFIDIFTKTAWLDFIQQNGVLNWEERRDQGSLRTVLAT